MAKTYQSEVDAVDDFLGRPKGLVGPPPPWVVSSRQIDFEAAWNIQDDLGIVSAQLRFRCPRTSNEWPTANVIFKGNPVWRVDLVQGAECKRNPPNAASLGLPWLVCGPHEHSWPDNRFHVLMNGFEGLPYRQLIPPQVRRVEQILPWLADRIKLTLEPGQRAFDAPPQSELFGHRG